MIFMVELGQSAKQAMRQRVSEHALAGIDLLERQTANAGQLAEHMLGEHGVAPGQLSETIAANVGAARHELAKGTRRSRKKLAKRPDALARSWPAPRRTPLNKRAMLPRLPVTAGRRSRATS